MPKGVYDRSKVGARLGVSVEAVCVWCGNKTYIKQVNSRPVCCEWICQQKEQARIRQHAANRMKKGKKRLEIRKDKN